MKYIWEIEIYEKAEHWGFIARVEASTEAEALEKARKLYPKREYRVGGSAHKV